MSHHHHHPSPMIFPPSPGNNDIDVYAQYSYTTCACCRFRFRADEMELHCQSTVGRGCGTYIRGLYPEREPESLAERQARLERLRRLARRQQRLMAEQFEAQQHQLMLNNVMQWPIASMPGGSSDGDMFGNFGGQFDGM